MAIRASERCDTEALSQGGAFCGVMARGLLNSLCARKRKVLIDGRHYL